MKKCQGSKVTLTSNDCDRRLESIKREFCIYENRAIILGIKTRKPLESLAVFGLQSFRPHLLAAGEGFEPSQTESESGVLPLHKPAMLGTPKRIYNYMHFARKVKLFFRFLEFFR